MKSSKENLEHLFEVVSGSDWISFHDKAEPKTNSIGHEALLTSVKEALSEMYPGQKIELVEVPGGKKFKLPSDNLLCWEQRTAWDIKISFKETKVNPMFFTELSQKLPSCFEKQYNTEKQELLVVM